MEKNIRDFNIFTAWVLERLYDNFPNPLCINCEDFNDNTDRETIRTYSNTLIFLKEEGFIRFSNITTDGVFMNVILTAKGLTLLNLVPEGIKERKSIIEKLREVLKEGSKIAIKTTVEALLRESIR